jgi:uncharacterized protein YdcH (DUF465 family)
MNFQNIGKIHILKLDNAHFAKLFDEYHVVTKEVENLENSGVPVSDVIFEGQKKKRAQLKDQLYAIIVS